MSGENRDEMLTALEADVKKAESKLKSAEISLDDINQKLKTADDNFQHKLSEKAAGYKAQTGADFVREVEKSGKVTYKFSRETTEKEQKGKQKLLIRRLFDSETGKYRFKPEFVVEQDDTVKNVNSAKDFKKPKGRKKFIAVSILGRYGKIELSTEVNNPFLNVIGKPVIVPVQAAAKLAEKISDSSVGKGISKTSKIISSPVIIPAKIIKDISDKGGIIHSVVDLGDRIKIEGFNAPKPVEAVGNVMKGTALGAETAANAAAESVKNFSVEIAKEKIYEEINKGISDNEAAKAVYVIGMKTAEIYRILDEYTKFRRAVRRDKAGDDVTDVNVSRYLAEKSEKKIVHQLDKIEEKKVLAEYNAEKARQEYEEARARLEQYQCGNCIDNSSVPLSDTADKPLLSKTDKEIQGTTRKLRYVKKHRYKVRFRRAVSIDRNGEAKMKVRPVIEHEFISGETPATAWNTAKRLDGLAVGTAAQSLRRKAMRDGGDNSGVEAGNFAITAVQQGNRLIKSIDEKERKFLEEKLTAKLEKLENQKKLMTESDTCRPKARETAAKSKKKSKKSSAPNKAAQKRNIRKRLQKNVYGSYAKKSKRAAAELARDVIRTIGYRSRSILIIIIPLILVALIPSIFVMCGTPVMEKTVMEQLISPCSINDLGLCDRYYTELGKNLIDIHQNIDSYYADYDKYVCKTEINSISHSPEKLLPYLAVKTLSESGDDNWNYEQARPHIEDVFNEQYEFYTNEIHETRKNVTTVVDVVEDEYYSSLGSSEYTHKRPTDNIPMPLKSDGYSAYANTYIHVEITVCDGYTENTLDSVGIVTNKDGNTSEYDEAQTITFNNYWSISLVYDWFDDGYYMEYWRYTEERQEYTEFDYVTLEYAIKENNIEVDDSYWTDTDDKWQDNNFDKLIYNRVCGFDSDEKNGFSNYFTFCMGQQELELPFPSPEIVKYPGYNNDIYGDMSLDYSMELATYQGQEIICGMDGEISPEGENSFSVYNPKYGTIFYDNAVVSDISKAKKGDVISSSTGDTLRITVIDNNADYLNPLFLFT